MLDVNAVIRMRTEGDVANFYLERRGAEHQAGDPLLFSVWKVALELDPQRHLFDELDAVLGRWLRRRIEDFRRAGQVQTSAPAARAPEPSAAHTIGETPSEYQEPNPYPEAEEYEA